jgi:hypothetical protein
MELQLKRRQLERAVFFALNKYYKPSHIKIIIYTKSLVCLSKMKQEKLSPCYTTSFTDMLTVKL